MTNSTFCKSKIFFQIHYFACKFLSIVTAVIWVSFQWCRGKPALFQTSKMKTNTQLHRFDLVDKGKVLLHVDNDRGISIESASL